MLYGIPYGSGLERTARAFTDDKLFPQRDAGAQKLSETLKDRVLLLCVSAPLRENESAMSSLIHSLLIPPAEKKGPPSSGFRS